MTLGRRRTTWSVLGVLAAIVVACSTATPPTAAPSATATPPATTTASAASSPSTSPTAGGIPVGGVDWSATALSIDDEPGARFLFTCPAGGSLGFLWGTDVYTTDSGVCTAAVHAGLFTTAEGGSVVIEIRPGQSAYVGSTRNGVSSSSYGSWRSSFVLVGAPLAGASPSATAIASPSPTASASATQAAFADELVQAGSLIVCSPFGRPRFADYDAAGEPYGVDVEIGQALAERLGLEAQMADTLFEELIPAVTGSQCDVSIGSQFITADRLDLIAMIPYRQGTIHVVVGDGNPLGIEGRRDLCGRRFAVVAATVYVDMVKGTGDYAGRGIDADCAAAGLEPVQLREFDTQAEAEEALPAGAADAFAGNDYVTVERPTEFDLSFALETVRNGIGLRLSATALEAALRAALREMIADGTYLAILERYGVAGNALTEPP